MLKSAAVTLLAACAFLAAGCGPKAPAPTVKGSMSQVLEPQAQTIWDVTNAAFNDRGDAFDPSKISPADWIRLEKAGLQLKSQGLLLAKTRNLAVAPPGEKLEGEGEGVGAPSAQDVQGYIDANPALFAQRARELADAGDTVAKAAKAKDIGPLFTVASGLDEVCDSCHGRFWDPQGALPAK